MSSTAIKTLTRLYELMFLYISYTRNVWEYFVSPPVDMAESYSEVLGSGMRQVTDSAFYLIISLPAVLLPLTVSSIVSGDSVAILLIPQLSVPSDPVFLLSPFLLLLSVWTTVGALIRGEKEFPVTMGLLTTVGSIALPFLPDIYVPGVAVGLIYTLGLLISGRIEFKFLSNLKFTDGYRDDIEQMYDESGLKKVLLVVSLAYTVTGVLYVTSITTEVYPLIGIIGASFLLAFKVKDTAEDLLIGVDTTHSGVRWLVSAYSLPIMGLVTVITAASPNKIVVLGLFVGPVVATIDFLLFTRQVDDINAPFSEDPPNADPIREADIDYDIKNETVKGRENEELIINAEFTVGLARTQRKKENTKISFLRDIVRLKKLTEKIGNKDDEKVVETLIGHAAENIDSLDEDDPFIEYVPEHLQEDVCINATDDATNYTMDSIIDTGTRDIDFGKY